MMQRHQANRDLGQEQVTACSFKIATYFRILNLFIAMMNLVIGGNNHCNSYLVC